MKCLNLGCGDRFHSDWENVDLYPRGLSIRVYDLRKKIPYRDESFDAVYHSHVLEHFPRGAALTFLGECHRVLKRGGVIRVAVPDLERIARLYLEALDKASKGVPGWDYNHEWMVIEMYDQCVRAGPCNGLSEYFNKDPIPNPDFILQRWGAYAIPFLEPFRQANPTSQNAPSRSGIAWRYVLRNLGTVLRNKILRMLMSKADWEALQVGRFRRAGEIHMWMYDYYSLGKLLEKVGFARPHRVGPAESSIPGWTGFHLDTEPDGRVYKADSMYMEADKP